MTMRARPIRPDPPARSSALKRSLNVAHAVYRNDVAIREADPFPPAQPLKRAMANVVAAATRLEGAIEKLESIDDGLADQILGNVKVHSRGSVQEAIGELRFEAAFWMKHAYDWRKGRPKNGPLNLFARKLGEAFEDAGAVFTPADLSAELVRAGHHVDGKAEQKIFTNVRKHLAKRRPHRTKLNKNLPT